MSTRRGPMSNIIILVSFALFFGCLYVTINDAIITNEKIETQAKTVMNTPATEISLQKIGTENSTAQLNLKLLHGLFGEAISSKKTSTNKKVQIVQFGPKSLEGIFIKTFNNEKSAWGLVTDEKGEYLVVPPEQVQAFSDSSMSIQTRRGLKSLHIKKDDRGIDIRKTRISERKQASGDKSIQALKPSRAQSLRQKILESKE